jgi:hypothetical protein
MVLMNAPADLPPLLHRLYEAAGPVIRYRLLRDVAGHDDSFIQTAHHGRDLLGLPEAQSLIAAQEMDGSWGGVLCEPSSESRGLSTEFAFLRLCELGLEGCDAVRTCIEKALLPSLFSPDLTWELRAHSEAERDSARRVVRDEALHLICRATREFDMDLRPFLEIVLAEWKRFAGQAEAPPPTRSSYAAVCWYPWDDDDFPRVRAIVKELFTKLERTMDRPPKLTPLLARHALRLKNKWEYLAAPADFLQELELAARLGTARDAPVTRWLLDELEARQDADGWFRFEDSTNLERSWYFPIETDDPPRFEIEWTFRGLLIYALLQYDL